MIRFNLRKLLGELESKSGRKITLREVCAQSGCDKNALSRLLNHPDVAPSARVIDDLVQYFFKAFKTIEPRKRDDVMMRDIIGKFISVYPNDFDIREPELEPLNEQDLEAWDHMGEEGRWQLYNHLKYGSSIDFEGRFGGGTTVIGDSPDWREQPRAIQRSPKATSSDQKQKAKPTKKNG